MVLLSLSGTAAESRHSGCFASGENRRNREGEKPPFQIVVSSRQLIAAWSQATIGGLSPSRFRLFSLCPKACYIPFPTHHAEVLDLYPTSIFARSGSRVLSTLVGSGVKPQRNPTVALKTCLLTNAENNGFLETNTEIPVKIRS